jgi:hypothetical protein
LSDESEGEAGESLPFVNSVPQTPKTPTRKSKATLKTTPPETPPATNTATKATPTKILPSSKARNNKRKGDKKQQHETLRSDYQGSAAAATTMHQTPGLLIVDGASRSKNARKDTASDHFPVENPYAGESQVVVKPEPGQSSVFFPV